MQRVEIVLGKIRLVRSFHRPRFSALFTTMRCLRSWTCELIMHGPRATAVRPTPASDDRKTSPRNSNPRIVRDILDNAWTRLALQTMDQTSSRMFVWHLLPLLNCQIQETIPDIASPDSLQTAVGTPEGGAPHLKRPKMRSADESIRWAAWQGYGGH